MSIEIPVNLEEAAMKVAQQQVRGHEVSLDEVIQQAVVDNVQAMLDHELDGHYDDAELTDKGLQITDFMGDLVGTITYAPDLVTAFKNDADQLQDYLAQQVAKLVGGR